MAVPDTVMPNDTSSAAASPSSASTSMRIVRSSGPSERFWPYMAVSASRREFIQFHPEYSPTTRPATPTLVRCSTNPVSRSEAFSPSAPGSVPEMACSIWSSRCGCVASTNPAADDASIRIGTSESRLKYVIEAT